VNCGNDDVGGEGVYRGFRSLATQGSGTNSDRRSLAINRACSNDNDNIVSDSFWICTYIHDFEARINDLKVLTNEKRGGMTVVSFDRSRFKLISRKF
jgi:hypothetical protein